MIRLRRRGVKAPADWRQKVDAAFADAAAFREKARAFERLAEQGKKRKAGFSAYAPQVLPQNRKGERDFPPLWRTDARVREAIAGMSHGFCAYCQTTVSSSHPGKGRRGKPPGQIEHFRPKSRFPTQAYAWDNYFLGCMGCNLAKHDKWALGGYVRPDEGRPGSRFVFAESGEVRERAGDGQARNTVEDFNLNRYWLAYHRQVAIRSHLKIVRRMMDFRGVRLEELLVSEEVAFSEAINQNVRRAWSQGLRGKPSQGARIRNAR